MSSTENIDFQSAKAIAGQLAAKSREMEIATQEKRDGIETFSDSFPLPADAKASHVEAAFNAAVAGMVARLNQMLAEGNPGHVLNTAVAVRPFPGGMRVVAAMKVKRAVPVERQPEPAPIETVEA